MIVMFFRHGKAEPLRAGISDEERKLTNEGRYDVELVAKAIPYKISRIYTSPLVRARETAEIIAKTYNVTINVVNELKPEICSLSSISRLDIVDGTVLVGHAPSIENVVSELIGGGKIKLKAGAVAMVDVEKLVKGGGTLIALITPDTARKIMEVKS